MCGRYILIDKIEAYEQRFNAVALKTSTPIVPNFNVAPGALAPVITNDKPGEIRFFRFGLTPFWAKKPMYLINARAEGDHNPDDDPLYKGAKGIISKPSFRKPIRSQRCLVIADYFIEGPKLEKLDKPYLVYLKRRPFAMAGIWDQWANPDTGAIFYSFSIITTTPNRLLRQIHHHRAPVILHENEERRWLGSDNLAEITSMLQPYDGEDMNAYPISPRIKNPRLNDISLLEPTGDPVEKDIALKVVQELRLQGMGHTRRDERRDLFS